MNAIDFPNGVCQRHGAMLAVNGVPTCIPCQAAAERASRPAAPVVSIEDPGHEAMSHIVPGPVKTVAAQAPKAVATVSLEQGLLSIKDVISKLPMPKNMAQFKSIKKLEELIDKALAEDSNG